LGIFLFLSSYKIILCIGELFLSKGKKGIPSRSASLFFKPSRNSVTHREEFQASAVVKTVEQITPIDGGAVAVTAGRTV
jgi:hypothetical protein